MLCLFAGSLSAEPLRLVQEIDAEGSPGAPFPPEAGVRLELRDHGPAALGWTQGRRSLPDGTHVSFGRDAVGAQRVYAIDPGAGELLLLRVSERAVASETRRLRELVGLDAAGIAVDSAGDRLFVLEASRGRIVVIDGFLRAARRRVSEIALPANPPPLRGLAFDPVTGHLHGLAPATGELLEIGSDGTLLAVRQFPEAANDVRAIAFAPSTARTDDPSVQHLFAVAPNDSGGTTLELSLEPLALAVATTVPAALLQTVLTSNFTPPSPDPSGVELLGPNGPLLISDGEVEEMSIYRGVNLWHVNLSGTVAATADTTFFSREPTGAAVNPANGHLFFSDDGGTGSVYEVTPGSDGKVSVGDTVRQIRVGNYGPIDCEGVAFGGGSLWIAAGTEGVYRISPGPNGVFDGGGDDVVSHFDTSALGLTDDEGIAYDSDGGNVYVAGPAQDNLIGHFSATGTLLRWIDISAASPKNPAGLAYGPAPAGGASRRLYVVARGTDNNTDSSENDGKLFVFSVDPLGGGGPSNQAPFVSAGNDLAVDLAASATLDGSVTDDGLPSGTLTITWSTVSGPGTVSFVNANAVDTTATFSVAGSYVVRLTAYDGQLSSSDEATILVTSSGGGGATTLEKRCAASADDAEQGASGSVSLTGKDLEIVADGSDLQTVGLRFGGLAIPPGAVIQSAWIQFQADETSTVAPSLTIQGEASGNAAPFTTGVNNVGARPRTSASVPWSPPAWNVVGEAGDPQKTPSLTAVVQEIVSRGDWLSGNALAVVITGSGSRVAESFEGTPTGAPLLHVVFGGAAGNFAPTVSAGPDRSVTLGQAASLDGTVSDDGLPSGTLTTTWSRISGPGSVDFVNANAVDTTASFSASGAYVLRLTAFDGERTGQDEMAVSVLDPNPGGVLDQRISLGSDDAEQRVSNGSMSVTGGDLDLAVDDTRIQLIGLRFPNLALPAGATIQNAWIQFKADEVGIAPASLTIEGEASANPGIFLTSASNVSGRSRTAASVPWSPSAWNVVGEAGDPQKTPSLTAVVQEIVNQPGWNPGNAMVFIVSGSGTRTAESFEGQAAGAALLHVEFGP